MAAADISNKMCAIAKELKASFTFSGKPITYEEVFSVSGLLPGLAKRADQLAMLCLGYGLGVTFEDAEGTLLGMKVKFDEMTPDILRYLFITDVLSELIKVSTSKDRVSLDELLYT